MFVHTSQIKYKLKRFHRALIHHHHLSEAAKTSILNSAFKNHFSKEFSQYFESVVFGLIFGNIKTIYSILDAMEVLNMQILNQCQPLKLLLLLQHGYE